MSAFQPISPGTALQVLESADVGVDCARLLVDLAEAGFVKGYARLVETSAPGHATAEVRDGRIDRAVWKRIVAEDKIADVYANASVRLGNDVDAAGRVSVLGIRFDEKSVRAAAVEHGPDRPAAAPRMKKAKPSPSSTTSEVVVTPMEPDADAPALPSRAALAADAIGASVQDAAAVLGLSRGTVYKLMDDGTLDSKKVGGRRLVSAESIRALMIGPAATK